MRKTRAVLVGTNAYPYLMTYWFELFIRYWQDEVDKVYIAVSQPVHPRAFGFINNYLATHPKIKVIVTGVMWPESINQVAKTIKEDLIGLFHDDTFIFKNGVVDKYFDYVEQTGHVVTPVYGIYSSNEIMEELMLRKWPNTLPLRVGETGETNYSFYTHFCFLTRELLHKTSIDFGEFHAKRGEYNALLDWTPLARDLNADTNFTFNLELYQAGAKFTCIPKVQIAQLYNLPDPIKTFKEMVDFKTGLFADDCGWIHLQTLAYHIGGLYWDLGEKETLESECHRILPPKMADQLHNKGVPYFTIALEFKIALIHEFMNVIDYSVIWRYHKHAKAQIEWIIDAFELNRKHMAYISKAFHKRFLKDV